MAGLGNLPPGKKVAALSSFLFLGLSPDYVDWQEHPEKRKQIVLYYGVGLSLFYYGLLS
jgi:hypothetical protein